MSMTPTPTSLGFQYHDEQGLILPLWTGEPWLSLIASLDDDTVPCPPVTDVPAYEVRPALRPLTDYELTRTLRGKKLARAALAYVEAHPEEHDQTVWRCETGMCLAGWAAALLPGWEWADKVGRAGGPDNLVRLSPHPTEEEIKSAPVRAVGQLFYEELGLDASSGTGDLLVDGDNKIADLKVLVDQFLRDLPLVRPTRGDSELEYHTLWADEVRGEDDGGVEPIEAGEVACWWADRNLSMDTVVWSEEHGRLVELEDGKVVD